MSEFTIKRLGHQGDGIADGPVYAPLTLPIEAGNWNAGSANPSGCAYHHTVVRSRTGRVSSLQILWWL